MAGKKVQKQEQAEIMQNSQAAKETDMHKNTFLIQSLISTDTWRDIDTQVEAGSSK